MAWVRAVGERSRAATPAQGKGQHGGRTASVSMGSSQSHEPKKLGLQAAEAAVVVAAPAAAEAAPMGAAEPAAEPAAGAAGAPGTGPGSAAPPMTAAAPPAAAAAAAAVDVVDAEGRTALHRAARAGNAQEVQQLLARGASVDVIDKHGATPAHYASVDGGIRLVHALLDAWKRRGTVPGPHKLTAAEEIAQMKAMQAMLREWSTVQQVLAAGSRRKVQ